MKVGMRNIKTAIAVSLSVAISRFFNMEYPFYTAIAAIISMQTTVGESFKVGRNRMLGTMLGAIVGVIFYFIHPSSVIIMGIGIMVVIYMCNLLGWNKSVSIAGIVFCVIMTNLDGRDPVFYALNRIFDTFIGIIIAVLVNYFVKPIDDYNNIEDKLTKIRCELNELVNDAIVRELNIDLENIEAYIKSVKKDIDDIHMNNKNEEEIKRFKSTIEKHNIACRHLRVIDDMDRKYTLNNINYMELVGRYGRFERMKYQKNKENDAVYNYHLRKIIKSIDEYAVDVIYFNSEIKINN